MDGLQGDSHGTMDPEERRNGARVLETTLQPVGEHSSVRPELVYSGSVGRSLKLPEGRMQASGKN